MRGDLSLHYKSGKFWGVTRQRGPWESTPLDKKKEDDYEVRKAGGGIGVRENTGNANAKMVINPYTVDATSAPSRKYFQSSIVYKKDYKRDSTVLGKMKIPSRQVGLLKKLLQSLESKNQDEVGKDSKGTNTDPEIKKEKESRGVGTDPEIKKEKESRGVGTDPEINLVPGAYPQEILNPVDEAQNPLLSTEERNDILANRLQVAVFNNKKGVIRRGRKTNNIPPVYTRPSKETVLKAIEKRRPKEGSLRKALPAPSSFLALPAPPPLALPAPPVRKRNTVVKRRKSDPEPVNISVSVDARKFKKEMKKSVNSRKTLRELFQGQPVKKFARSSNNI